MKSLSARAFADPSVRWLHAVGEICGHPGLFKGRIEAPSPSAATLANGPLLSVTPTERKSMNRSWGVLDGKLSHLGIGEAGIGYMMGCIAHYAIDCPGVDGIPEKQEMRQAYEEVRASHDWNYAMLLAQWRIGAVSAIGVSRLPDDIRHLEDNYWEHIVNRLDQFRARFAEDVRVS